METFTLPQPWLITHLMQYTYKLETGLILVAGSESNWIDFILLGLLGSYQNDNFNIINKNVPPLDAHYFKYPVNSRTSQVTDKELHYYGAIRDIETLENSLESAKEKLTIAAIYVTRAEDVVPRMKDVLETRGKNIEDYKNLLKCVISYDDSHWPQDN